MSERETQLDRQLPQKAYVQFGAHNIGDAEGLLFGDQLIKWSG